MNKEEEYIRDIDAVKKIVSNSHIVKINMETQNNSCIIPLNYGYEISGKDLILYCHFNYDIRKINLLDNCPNVNIEITDEYPIRNNTLAKNKIKSNARIEFVDNIYDKIRGLNKIIEHSSSENNDFKNKVINNIMLVKIICNNLIVNIY